MRYETVGREIYRGAAFQIYTSDELFLIEAEAEGVEDTFQLMYIEQGTVLLHAAGGKKALIPPLALCINYRERFDALEMAGCRGFSIVFKPEVVNHSLNRWAQDAHPVDRAFQANKVLINPFLKSNRGNPFFLSLDHRLQERIQSMYTDLKAQLADQPDQFWPCRSRSFFLEILMFLHNLYGIRQGSLGEMVLPAGNPRIEALCAAAQVGYPRKELSLKVATRELGVPAREAAVSFRRLLGRSFEAYLAEVRITVAATLARNTILGFDAIRKRCGYPHAWALRRAFQKAFGQSPEAYRAAHPDPYG